MYMPERYQLEFHPEYSMLDRDSLMEIFTKHFPGFTDSRMRAMSRQELINLIQEQEGFVAREDGNGDLSEMVSPPLRYSRKQVDLPRSLAPGQGMYYCWENADAAVEAAISLAKGDVSTREWNLGEDVPEGSLLLTVLGTTPPLVAAMETVTSVTEEKVYVDQLAVFSDPICLYDLESMIDSGLPRSSKALSLSTGKRVLKSLHKLVKEPQRLVISTGQCANGADQHSNDAVHVLAMLQRDYDDVPLCDGCGRDVGSETSVHFFHPHGGLRNWDIQDHVDEVGLLCQDCHVLVHGPTKKRLQKVLSAAPRCPECGEGNPRRALWGYPAIIDDDNYATMGCVLPIGPPSEWVCRNCETPYAVVAHPETLMPEDWVQSILENRRSKESQ